MCGSKNPIPENCAQTVSTIRVSIMVKQMASFNSLKPCILEIEEMRPEVHEVVNHVTEYKSGKEPCSYSAILENEVKDPIKEKC
jgi:hypothetical protein